MSDTVTHTAEIWVWSNGINPASWHFITLSGEAGEAVAAHEAMRRLELGKGRGFGSVKVTAQIGETLWHTSVFPSQSADGYLLPIKAAVRKVEKLKEGDSVLATLDLL